MHNNSSESEAELLNCLTWAVLGRKIQLPFWRHSPFGVLGVSSIFTKQEQPQQSSTSFPSGTPASSSTRKQQSCRQRIIPQPEFGTTARPAVVSVKDTDQVVSDLRTLYSGAECFVIGDSTPSDFPTSPAPLLSVQPVQPPIQSATQLSSPLESLQPTFQSMAQSVAQLMAQSVFTRPSSRGCVYTALFVLFSERSHCKNSKSYQEYLSYF
ncbi:uncharacterized protein LOC120435678 isoform X1 [Oreochromis aureus]|uniref:uncharacterized protein LOC120435678 isoform X1 n=1 Tax=Oreochromis aureus TaxID=47969 RepID=UPI0019534C02|nr:uncharacterized protein LOC120435678 isoform X1 [Oreochromis aureus]